MSDEEGARKKTRAARRQRRPRGQLHCVQEPRSGIFQLRGTIRGTKVRESTGTSDATIADAIRIKKETELLNESVHGKAVVITFAECVENYLRQRDGGSNNRYLPALIEKFGKLRTKDLTPTVIKNYADEKYAGCAGQTKNVSVINPIIAVLRRAAFDQLCALPAIERYEEKSEPITGAPPEWIAKMLADCPRVKVKAYIALMTTTGCRGIDAIRLRSENVNYKEGTAYLPKTKNDDARTLQVIAPVMEMLKQFPHGKDGSVFGWSRTDDGNTAIQRCCVQMGVEYYSGHRVGRHAFAERMLSDGQTLQEVMKAGGWRDINVLSKRYGHLEKSKVDAAVREQAARVMQSGLKVVKDK